MKKAKKKVVWATIGDFRSMSKGGIPVAELIKAMEQSIKDRK